MEHNDRNAYRAIRRTCECFTGTSPCSEGGLYGSLYRSSGLLRVADAVLVNPSPGARFALNPKNSYPPLATPENKLYSLALSSMRKKVGTTRRSPSYERFLKACSLPFMRIAKHLTALRA